MALIAGEDWFFITWGGSKQDPPAFYKFFYAINCILLSTKLDLFYDPPIRGDDPPGKELFLFETSSVDGFALGSVSPVVN
jgi:hypothetical protein